MPSPIRTCSVKLLHILVLACFLALGTWESAQGQTGPDRILTIAVLVNSANTAGFNTNPSSPGEFQRYPERYLEHLQVPYAIFDVSTASPPSDLSSRQLILAGHSGLNLSAAWQTAITSAVNSGVGFVNLDWDASIGLQSHIQAIFGATGSFAGTSGSAITIPAAVRPGGPSAHFISALQQAFQGDVVNGTGDIIYNFHADANGVVQTVRSTVLTGTTGVVLARIGTDPLITTGSLGQGRAVHFGTLAYLKADRFGFLLGVDDLFWRSLVWAARKPFVVRGYPRLWAVQMDDTLPGWGFRVRDLYDPNLTGTAKVDGTGGPWKVTGFVYMDELAAGTERASVISDIRQGLLQITPHSQTGTDYGDLYWNGSAGALSDSHWLSNLSQVQQWKTGLGGADTIPSFSRSLVAHFWDISDNTGYDLWNTLGFRYATAIQKPGFQNFENVTINGGAERLHARPFWLYEQPPKTVRDENYPFFFADDYPVNSRAGFPSQTLFLFATQLQDRFYPRADVIWPSSIISPADSIDQFQRYTSRFWSSLAPVQIYTHDSNNYSVASTNDRQSVIRQVSSWLQSNGVVHTYMQGLGDYTYARTKSVLKDVRLSGNDLTYIFSGNTATADGVPIPTQVLVFLNNSSEGVPDTIPGFSTSNPTILRAVPPPPPNITSITPASGAIGGGTSTTIAGDHFINVTNVLIGGNPASGVIVIDPTSITATAPPGITGPADVVVITATGTATLPSGYRYLGPPRIETVDPVFGPQAGGVRITITGEGFEPTSTVKIGSTLATGVIVTNSSILSALTPIGPPGPADVTITNSQGSTTAHGVFSYLSGSDVIHLGLNYATRDQLVAAGWSFSALTETGIPRNTEQTTGLVVSYDQVAHPGVIRIPVDAGDIWQNTNNSRNTLFYSLPGEWRSIKLKIAAFTPDSDFQQVGLVAYQDDDNFVIVARNFNSGAPGTNMVEFGTEGSGLYGMVDSIPAPTGTTNFLRLDRDPVTNVISAFTSNDGVTWIALSGHVTQALTNPRLGILVGANKSQTSFPNADIEYAEIVVIATPPSIAVSPQNLTFAAIEGGVSPQPQTVTIGNSGGQTLNWTAQANATWLPVTPTNGTAPSTVTVAANTAGLTRGTYITNVSVTAPNASNSPQSITVTLTISPPPVPTITGISPASGSTLGGTSVTITGSGFTAATTVIFGGVSPTSVVVNDATSINAVTPAHAAGAADVSVTTVGGTAALPGGFTYIAPGAPLLTDDFSSGSATNWLISPLGNAAGWSVVNGAFTYNGGGPSQAYQGDPTWGDYTLQVGIRLSTLNNWPGGIRGRLNPTTGAGYALWLYPATGQLVLYRATGWNIDSPGLVALGSATGIPYVPGTFHRVRMTFQGSRIDVYFDGLLVLTTTDTSFASGVIALDVSNQPVTFDNISVTFGANPPASTLAVTPTSLSFAVPEGAGNPPTQALTVNNTGDGVLTWTASSNATWLTATPTSGSAPATVTVSVNSGVLSRGTYNGAVTINAPGTTGAPQSIPVTLTVIPPASPTVSSILPGSGSTAGGTAVTITGTGFLAGTTVTFGATPATNVVVNSATSLSATTPIGVPGAVNVVVANANGSVTLPGGFTYIAPGTVLLTDDFSSGSATNWLISPLGNAAGWSVVNGAFTYNGGGHTQAYRGDPTWGDYTLQVSVQLSSLNNYPGGIRGRVNPTTGAGYAIWLYPATGQLVLFRATAWNIDSPGLTALASATGIPYVPGTFHRVRMTFQGSRIDVYFDGVLVLTTNDTAYANGVIALDVGNQLVSFDNISVTFGANPPAPTLAVTPTSLSFAVPEGAGNPPTQALTVNNTGDGVLTWTASSNATWLTATPTSGSAPATVTVSVNSGVLSRGTYNGAVTINAPGTTGAPQTIPVTLTVTPASSPTVSSILPSSGSTAGGTAVTITGTGFLAGTTVTFGASPATNVVVNSATSLSATTPIGVAGAVNVVVTTVGGSATLPGGFTYIAPGTPLLTDDFSNGSATNWLISPLGNAAGWSVVNGAFTYNGGGHTQAYRGDPTWGDYTLQVSVQLSSLNNYPGGIRGRVNPTTGAGYAIWLYPATGQLVLFRATAWNIDSPGLTALGSVTGIPYVPGTFHRLRMTFQGSRIDVYFDGVLVLTTNDTAYANGVIALDVSNQPVAFDNVLVTTQP